MVGRLRVRWAVPIAAAAIVVGGTVAFGALSDNFTNPPAPVPGHGQLTFLTLTGQKQGKITGGSTSKLFPGAIPVLALDLGLATPRDPQTGLPTGRTVCNGVGFRKPTDRATPQLFQAAATNETITSAVFNEVAISQMGAASATMTVSLTNAFVAQIHHVDSTTTGAYDDVTIAAQKVQITWNRTHSTASYDCTSAG